MATTVTLKPNAIDLSGSTSGTTTLQASAVAGTTTVTLPAATDTLVGKATTDTLTNKTLTSPTMTAPVLGTPASGTVTNLTGTASININGTVGATTPAAGSFTTLSASGVIQGAGGNGATLGYHLGTTTATFTPRITNNNSNDTVIRPGASGTRVVVNNFANSAENLVITDAGVLDLPIGQIKFPATQNASADANTLDDYEEGTWAPELNGSITTPTYTLQTGIYTKIGDTVTIAGRITISAGTPTGTSVGLTNVPFAPRASTGNIVVGNAIVRVSNNSGDKNVKFWLEASSTTAYLQYSESSGVTPFTGTQLGATGSFAFSCTYQV